MYAQGKKLTRDTAANRAISHRATRHHGVAFREENMEYILTSGWMRKYLTIFFYKIKNFETESLVLGS